ncbi:ketoacyl-ACP synthase III [Wenzhouxiangella sp. XN24]|uniref:beta-ketoacyl-ACP synthase 3 n=1 Tax=Wenzhouxiangella sp. XN24 TaxID=2713569 RepID=UPI00197F925F
MRNATITGWGKCMPPAVLSNADIANFLDTDDEWITSRTGIRERRISHVSLETMGTVAAQRALACAGLDAERLDLIVFGTCSFDQQVPNTASGVQKRIGAVNAGAMDVNTACTSYLYGLTTAAAMISQGVVNNALVIGGELISPLMDWTDRGVAVLFGDGCAATVLQATDKDEGLRASKLGCYGEVREILLVHGMGQRYANRGWVNGDTQWVFEGQEIFKRAVVGMSQACQTVLDDCGMGPDDVDLVVPHQANLRIIEAVVKRAGVSMDRCFVNVHRYGNMSAATVPVALVEALEEGRIKPHANLLLTGFGGGLSWAAQMLRWGERVTPLGESDATLPPCERSGLEMVQGYLAAKHGSRE